jgi:TolB protein
MTPHPNRAALLTIAVATTFTLRAHAQTPTPPPASEGAIGVVEVTGAAAAPLPKLAVVPITGEGDDTTTREILKKDLDRMGLYDVVDESAMPAGPFAKDDAIDGKAWKSKGIAIVVRAKKEGDSLLGEAYLLGKSEDPIGKQTIKITSSGIRRASHELADQVLSSLTGRSGPFASRVAYALRTGKGRQLFVSDVDGQGKIAHGSKDDTALSPAFGPNGELWFTVSKVYDPFKLAHGATATLVPLKVVGSVLSVSFSPDRSKLAVSIMKDNESGIFVGKPDGSELAPIEAGKFANRPVLGPLGKLAYVASAGTQRVYVDKNVVSPAGFHASAPTFCDSPQGLIVVFTVGVGSGADLIATDTSGGNLRRLTQGHGSNAYPACSPDGRLVAFFSTGANGKAPGLYVLPIANPTRIRKLSDDHGDALAWAR